MLVLHPEQKEMAMYKHIGVMKSNLFALFVKKMWVALVSKDVPMDYHLEAALPGVQQRLQMLETGQTKLGRRMDVVEMTVVTNIEEEGKKIRETIANGLETAALAMMGGGGQASKAAAVLNRLQMRTRPSDGGLLALSDHQFYANHKSVQSFYNEYHSLGNFKDVPVAGGCQHWRRSTRPSGGITSRGGKAHQQVQVVDAGNQ
jgi:hypothetical protein